MKMNDLNSKMKLATAHYFVPDNYISDPLPSFDRCFGALKKAGYDRVNVDFWGICQKGEWMNVDSWEDTVAEIAELSKKHRLPIYQTHSNSYHGKEWDDPSYEKHEFMEWSNLRCIRATAMLGAKYIVIHPKNLPHDPLYSAKKAKEANLAYLEPFINEAKKCGVSIAVENMVDFRGNRRRYCGGDIYELIDLVDTINDVDVGICLDTGHANIGGARPAEAILEIGSRLKATHINDNHAKEDEHLLPYFGNIDWASVSSALKAVGYEGDFAFEVNEIKKMPSELCTDWLAYSAVLGRKLMNGLN
jgi:sugar phosphate isomerase/epimerase